MGIGKAQEKLGEYKFAITSIKKACDYNQDSKMKEQFYFYLGLLHKKLGEFE